jgi:hypothetical protein
MNQSEKPPKPAKNKYQCPKATAPQRHRDTKKNHTRARAQRSGYRNRNRHRNLTLIKNISRKELEKKMSFSDEASDEIGESRVMFIYFLVAL